MTLQQLKYILRIADCGTISEAAKSLFLSQPSLTAAVHDLENEIGITIFLRTNKGVQLTTEGEEFLGYARQVIEQTNLIEEKYIHKSPEKLHFCVSAQHYSFVVEAFVDLIKNTSNGNYDFRIRETQTYEIIEDVSKLRSEIGILYLNSFNQSVILKELQRHDIHFTPLFVAKPHVFLSASHPLSSKKKIFLQDLEEFPRLSYEQGEHNAFYYSEEILSTLSSCKDIVVRDRATLFNLLVGLNGYTICTGILNETLNGNHIVSIPLDCKDSMQIGYITHNRVIPNLMTIQYIESLKKCINCSAL